MMAPRLAPANSGKCIGSDVDAREQIFRCLDMMHRAANDYPSLLEGEAIGYIHYRGSSPS